MEYINRNLQKIREKIALDRLNAVVAIPLSINGVTSGAVSSPTVKSVPGAIQFTNDTTTDTAANTAFKFTEDSLLLTTPGSIQFGTINNPSYIIFPDGTTQGSASMDGGEF